MTPDLRPACLALLLLATAGTGVLAQDTALVAVTDGPAAAATAPEADTPAPATEPELEIRDGYDVSLDAFKWTHRPLVIFADSPADPRFHEQMAELLADVPALVTRDVIVFTDTDPAARSALRQKLRPRGFMLVLIGKDGSVALRKPLPWSVRELSRTIDKMPMRLREVEERRGG